MKFFLLSNFVKFQNILNNLTFKEDFEILSSFRTAQLIASTQVSLSFLFADCKRYSVPNISIKRKTH